MRRKEAARYASQPTLPQGQGFPAKTPSVNISPITPMGTPALGSPALPPNPLAQLTPQQPNLANEQGVQQALQKTCSAAQTSWPILLGTIAKLRAKQADTNTSSSPASPAGTDDSSNVHTNTPQSPTASPTQLSQAPNAAPRPGAAQAKPLPRPVIQKAVAPRPQVAPPTQQMPPRPVAPKLIQPKPPVAPGVASLATGSKQVAPSRPVMPRAAAPAPSRLKMAFQVKRSFTAASLPPTPGLTANMPMPPGPAGAPAPAPSPSGAVPPPSAPAAGPLPPPPPGGMALPPGAPAGPAGMAPPQGPTAPMQDAPPMPLPANPRPNPPSPKTSDQAMQEALLLEMMEAKQQGQQPVNEADATNDLQSQGMAMGTKLAALLGKYAATLTADEGGENAPAGPGSPMRGWQWKALLKSEDEADNAWTPRLFKSDETPLIELLASPGKQGLLGALAGSGVGAAAGYFANKALPTGQTDVTNSLIGGGLGGVLGGIGAYGHRRRTNDKVLDALRRTPPGATVWDYKQVQDSDAKLRGGLKNAFWKEAGLPGAAAKLLGKAVRPTLKPPAPPSAAASRASALKLVQDTPYFGGQHGEVRQQLLKRFGLANLAEMIRTRRLPSGGGSMFTGNMQVPKPGAMPTPSADFRYGTFPKQSGYAAACTHCNTELEIEPRTGKCNRCGGQNKEAGLTPFAQGFFAHCEQLGLDPKQAVEKIGSEFGIVVENELRDGLIKLAIGIPPGATKMIGGLLSGGAKAAPQALRKGVGFAANNKAQVANTALGAALGASEGYQATDSGWGAAGGGLLGAAAFNKGVNKALSRGTGNYSRPLVGGLRGSLYGSGSGALADMGAQAMGYDTDFASIGRRIGGLGGATRGLGSTMARNFTNPAVRNVGATLRATGKGIENAPGWVGRQAINFARGKPSFQIPSAATNLAGRAGLLGGLGVSGAMGINRAVDAMGRRVGGTALNTAMDNLMGAGPEINQAMAERFVNPMLGHIAGQADQYMQSRGMMGQDGQFDPTQGLVNKATQGFDSVLQRLGIDPSRLSPMQKLMLGGGSLTAAGGALTGHPMLAGAGGLAALGGLVGPAARDEWMHQRQLGQGAAQ